MILIPPYSLTYCAWEGTELHSHKHKGTQPKIYILCQYCKKPVSLMFTEMPDTILLQVLYQEWMRFDTVTVGVKQCCTNPEFPAFGLTKVIHY